MSRPFRFENARIILAGDPYWYDLGAGFRRIIQGLADAPGAATHHAYFDAANLHLYSRPTELAPIVSTYRAILARFGLRKPIWTRIYRRREPGGVWPMR